MTWDALHAAALLGTARAPLPDTPDPLAPDLPLDTDAETALLSRAALHALSREAGYAPQRATAPLPEAARPDPRPEPGPHARHLLSVILASHAALLPEYLTLAVRAGMRAPHAALPALLHAGRQHRDLRARLIPFLGTRGAWIAQHNADWHYAAAANLTDTPGEDAWHTGTHEERTAALRALRATNPARARELLQEAWTQETPARRASLLATLNEHLDSADEPFLEAALDDKRKEVRSTAAELLARLPDSRLARRMQARLAAHVHLTPARLLRRASLTVTLPAECDKSMQRDGINPKPEYGQGERAWWLQQILALTPPDLTENALGADFEALVQLAHGHEHQQALLAGLALAVARHPTPERASVILARVDLDDTTLATLLRALPPEAQDAHLRRALQEGTPPGRLNILAQAAGNSWSEATARAAIARLRPHVAAAKNDFWQWASLLGFLALRAPPALASELDTLLPPDSNTHYLAEHNRQAVHAAQHTLRLRAEMHKELQP